MKDNLKKKKTLLIIGIVSLILILLGSTYAFFTYSKSVDAFVLTSNRISATFESGTNSVSFTNAYPISDTYALDNLDRLTYIDFTVSGEVGSEDSAISYVIYLTEELNNTLSSDYIKVYLTDDNNNTVAGPSIYSSLDYTTYSGSASGRVIYTGNQSGTFSKNYRLYVWLDSTYEQNTVSQIFTFKVNLYAYNDTNKSLAYTFKNTVEEKNETCATYVEEDGITYISGSSDCIDFNYVWYSGKLWRITAIYPDGTMKMITDDNITTIDYGGNVNFYTDESNSSYMYQWLNEDFLSTLYNYENIIVTDASWNATNSNASSVSEVSTKLPETTMVTSPVGLLNSYEYYKSYQNASPGNVYLNNDYSWWLLNPYSSSFVWLVYYYGSAGCSFPDNETVGVRPSINLQSGITINSGTGTSDDPYTISGDKETVTANTTFLNTRQSGEYVNFDGELYRIVGIENNTTKLNKMDYVRDSDNTVIEKNFSSSSTFGSGDSDTYWDYYLNNTWYNSISETYKNMLVEGTYYLGTPSGNYKGAICATVSNTVTTADCEKTSSTWTGYVGLPRFGEMFVSQQGSGYSTSEYMWLITPCTSSDVWTVSSGFRTSISGASRGTLGAHPSINLSSAVKITGGTGLKNDPFEISL